MFYRRKLILALLQQFGGKLNPTPFQKLLLIFTRRQQKPAYEFVPYKYGAFSFQARADKGTMIKYGLLKKSKQWVVSTDEDYIRQLKEKDQQIFSRRDAKRVIGLPERSARRVLSALEDEELVISESHKSPVRFSIPPKVVGYYFPDLYPEGRI